MCNNRRRESLPCLPRLCSPVHVSNPERGRASCSDVRSLRVRRTRGIYGIYGRFQGGALCGPTLGPTPATVCECDRFADRQDVARERGDFNAGSLTNQ